VTSRGSQRLVLLAVLALSFNLRPAAVSVGPVLEEVRLGTSMSSGTAGILTALPALSFAVFGAVAPWAARVVGLHRVTLLALLAVVAGLGGRAVSHSVPVFLVLSVVALGGMAIANVLLPSLIKLHFPDRVGFLSTAYTTALAVGLTLASVLTVPIAEAAGSWRWGLGAWALTALVAAVPWLAMIRHDAHPDGPGGRRGGTTSMRDVARTRLGWCMAVTFGVQSMQAYTVFGWFAQLYRDAGFSPAVAGLLLGVITATSIPVSLWVPGAAARRQDQTRMMLGLIACLPVGYVGLLLAPAASLGLALVWAVLVGIGQGTFPLILTLIGLRTRTPDGTASLSGFTQAVGYLLAASAPAAVGIMYEATGGWTSTLLFLLVLVGLLCVLGPLICRPVLLEDQLADARERSLARS
jgi:MFS transporter, CP family, cyanate transporter